MMMVAFSMNSFWILISEQYCQDECNNCVSDEVKVCGSDGFTYSDKCELCHAKCDGKPDLVVGCTGCSCPCPCNGNLTCAEKCLQCQMENQNPGPEEAVCGTDGITYADSCRLLQCGNCNDPSVVEQCKGNCPCRSTTPPPPPPPTSSPCQQICSQCNKFPPPGNEVCASDGLTYADSCALLCASCNNPVPGLVEDCKGVCPCAQPPPPDPCVRNCNNTFELACGSDGLTYPSVCVLEQVSCLNPTKKIKPQCMGKCPCIPGNMIIHSSIKNIDII